MQSSVSRPGIDLTERPARPALALLLAILAVPGSTVAWDLPGGGFVFGFPLAIAAVILGVQARRRSQTGQTQALAAILIAGAMLAMMIVWLVVEAL
jgi:biotin transporter BioY